MHLECKTPVEDGYIDQRSLYIKIYSYLYIYVFLMLFETRHIYICIYGCIRASPITNVFDCRKTDILRVLDHQRTLVADCRHLSFLCDI